MAHLSGDPGLVAAFASDLDVHVATAAEVFGVATDAVSSDQRRTAKTINFGLIYGMSPFGLARQLGIGRGAAQDYVNRYFARYPGVRQFMDDTASGRAVTAMSKPCAAAALSARHPFEQSPVAAVLGAQRHQCPDAGDRGGHHQNSDDPRR